MEGLLLQSQQAGVQRSRKLSRTYFTPKTLSRREAVPSLTSACIPLVLTAPNSRLSSINKRQLQPGSGDSLPAQTAPGAPPLLRARTPQSVTSAGHMPAAPSDGVPLHLLRGGSLVFAELYHFTMCYIKLHDPPLDIRRRLPILLFRDLGRTSQTDTTDSAINRNVPAKN